jgi:hypothetical protein
VVADARSPKTTIHTWWNAFVPSLFFLTLFLATFLYIVGTDPLTNAYFALSNLAFRSVTPEILEVADKLEIFKLAPFALAFALAFVLYLFDRIALGLGHSVPPFPSWSGLTLLHLNKYDSFDLWRHSPDGYTLSDLEQLSRTLVERARAEKREDLLRSIDYLDRKFSSAANAFAYSKSLLLWSTVCAFWAAYSHPVGSTFALWFPVAAIAAAAAGCSLMVETHFLLELCRARLWVAATLRRVDSPNEPSSSKDFKSFDLAWIEAYVGRHAPFLRLKWGSLEATKRLLKTFRKDA